MSADDSDAGVGFGVGIPPWPWPCPWLWLWFMPAPLLALEPACMWTPVAAVARLMLIIPPRLWLSLDEPALELDESPDDDEDEDDELDDVCADQGA